MSDAQVYDFNHARQLRQELAALEARNRRLDGASINCAGQMSLDAVVTDPGNSVAAAPSAFTTVIGGITFTCTTWGGSSNL